MSNQEVNSDVVFSRALDALRGRFRTGRCVVSCVWWLGLWILGTVSVSAADRELLSDPGFRNGFRVIAPTAGKRVVVGQMDGERAGSLPAWDLDQWHSRFPFSSPQATRAGLQMTYSNAAKWVILSNGVMTLGVDSRMEYTNVFRRASSEPWVHLLVEQAITNCPSVQELSALRLRLGARLIDGETFRAPGYSPGLHAAQFQLVVTLGNTRRESEGYGDFLWFVVPLYDDRHAQPPRYVSRDFADPSSKLIFNPGTDAFTSQRLIERNWVEVDRDIRPFLLEALKEAWRLGYLRGSRDLKDYRLTTLNLGWEVPGLNRVSIAVKGLSLLSR